MITRPAKLGRFALALFTLAGLAAPAWARAEPPASKAEAVAKEPSELKWVRVKQDERRNLRLQVAQREFVPAKDNGPSVTLQGAVHIGDAEFYKKMQEDLDGYDLILYEGVSPSGSDNPKQPASDTVREERTRNRIRLIAIMLERAKHNAEGKAYPKTLDELQASLIAKGKPRQAAWVGSAKLDGWSHPLIYELSPDGASFTLTSLGKDNKPGGDGPDADQSLADQKPLSKGELGSEEGIQKKLASALGLTFQLDQMHETSAKWINADITVDDLQDRLGTGDEGRDTLLSILDPSSLPAQIAGFILGIVEKMPAISVRAKVMMVELLGNADEALMGAAAAQGMGGEHLMKVIIQERNQVVIDDLQHAMRDHPEAKRIAIIYGAGHMPDLSAKLVKQLDYRHKAGHWITAVKVDLDAAGIDEEELQMTEEMIGQQMEMLKKMK